MNMTVQRNESNLNGPVLNGYDPLIWRKYVNVNSKNSSDYVVVLDSGNFEIAEKNVENMFWTSVYSRIRL
jgi:hypothetical protein